MSATPASSTANGSIGGNGMASTGSTSSASASASHVNKRQRIERGTWRATGSDIQPALRKYTPTPTNGTAPLHSSQDIGHADFYPAKAGQNESQLNERTIRYGYVDMPRVDYEHASSHDVVYERLQDARVLQDLQAFAAGTTQRQWARGSIPAGELPRLPNRAVRSDERREEWFRNLSNPHVPLSILANSMPFVPRGERLLASLCQHAVPLQRAIWAIRLTGVYELFGSQTRIPDHASIKALEGQYTVQWSKQFTQFVEHMLAAAPTGATDTENSDTSLAPTPSNTAATHVVSTPLASTSAAATTTPTWTASWAFCLSLLHAQYSQGLLDQRHLVSWLVGQFRHASIDKCMLIMPLVCDYTMDVGKSRTPLRKLIGAVSFRIEQIEKYPSLQSFHNRLCNYLVLLFTTFPDAFVEPTTWPAYHRALSVAGQRLAKEPEQTAALKRLLKKVDFRNSRFSCLLGKKDALCSSLPPGTVSRPESCSVATRAAPLHVLNALTPDSDIGEAFVSLFSATAMATHVVRLICFWAVEDQVTAATTQFRQLAAAQLCSAYINSQPSGAATTTADSRQRDVQSAVIGFLDVFALPGSGGGRRCQYVWRMCSLLERLADVGGFSISKYLQLLTARGDFFGSNLNMPRPQRHLEYVLHLPTSSGDIKEHRQMLLYDCQAPSERNGHNGDTTSTCFLRLESAEDERMLAQLKRDFSELLPFMLAYTCATPLRARNCDKSPTIDLEIARWWIPDDYALQLGVPNKHQWSLLDVQMLPSSSHFTATRLVSPWARDVCAKDWIAPLADHTADEQALNRDFSFDSLRHLQASPRNVVDVAINQRLLPAVYDYVVKDVKVGVDNWRVITRPGTSLLNRRQTAVVISALVESGLFRQLLDFLLWLLSHSNSIPVLSLTHCTLRRFTHVWRQLGKLSAAIEEVRKVLGTNSGGIESFDFELYRTAQHWSREDGGRQISEARGLAEQTQHDYDAYTGMQAQSLLQGGHATLPANTSKDVLYLSQQLVRERMREPSSSASSSSSLEEVEWTILPCFQKLGRWAQSATQRGEFASSPAMQHHDTPSSPPSSSAARLPKLQAMLAHIVADATQAALVTSRTLPLAPLNTPDRAKDVALLRCFVALCAQLIRWFSVCSGLAPSPSYIGPLILKAMSSAVSSWTLSQANPPRAMPSTMSASSSSTPLGHSVAASPVFSVSEVELGVYAAYIWVSNLLASGCLRIDDLIPWLIEMSRAEPTQQNIAQYTCLVGIMLALGMPTGQLNEAHHLSGDDSNGSDGSASGSSRNGGGGSISGGSDYGVFTDLRQPHELLEIASNWQAVLDGNRVCRIQAIELVFIGASASGRLRAIGHSRLAATLMRATTALAQSPWIIAIVDLVPFSPDSTNGASDPLHGPYYSMLEIYRANIESQIHDPAMPLPVKRAILRALMTLCEGIDPETEGFSAMTTAEVAHRLHETIRRFWYGPAAKGGHTMAASKLATILNSLLLFASTALQESEATTDAFAVAAGAKAMSSASMDDARARSDAVSDVQDIGGVSRDLLLGNASEQVQFVTNTTAYLSTCVLDAALNWSASQAGDSPVPLGFADQRCVGLAEALSTLSPDILLSLVESCAGSLLSVNSAKLRAAAAATNAESAATAPLNPARPNQTPTLAPATLQESNNAVLDRHVAAVISAFCGDVSSLLDVGAAESSGMEFDNVCGDAIAFTESGTSFAVDMAAAAASFTAYAERGSALAKLVQFLVHKLVRHIDSDAGDNAKQFSASGLLAALRDLASGILGQIQAICLHINPAASVLLALKAAEHAASPSHLSSSPAHIKLEEAGSDTLAPSAQPASKDELDQRRLHTALCWRLQVIQPMCSLFRQFPDEFGVGEWLITLVTLCLSSDCQPRLPAASTAEVCDESSGELYQYLLDFAAVTNESITPAMRKVVLGSLRSATPLLRSAIQSTRCAEALGRLFPFDASIALTSDIQPLISSSSPGSLDNPWMWIEGLEFVSLAPLGNAAIFSPGLESMTPFTLRGTLQQEAAVRGDRNTGSSSVGTGAGSGYGLGMRSNSSTGPGPSSSRGPTNTPHRPTHLDNPYFPMQPSFLLPLAETPISWHLFGAKRRRLDSETRLVWRGLCKATFAPDNEP